jgi:KDO2-lipid IV(A) lauroyltransferase
MARPRKRRRDKKPHPRLDWAVYVGLRIVAAVLNVLPVRLTLAIACGLGKLLWRCYPRGRERALENLIAAYPQKDQAWLVKTAKRSFEHIAMLSVDILLTPTLARKDNWQQYGEYKNVEHAKWLMQEGKGLILVTGHYGNFEILGYIMGLFGFDLSSVARPLDNKHVDQYIRGIREKHGQKIIDKRGAANLMSQVGSQGASLGLIADQDAGKRGLIVDFFGRPASTFKSIAVLAAVHNMPVAVGYSRRIGNQYRFEIGVKRIIFPEEWAAEENPIRWITEQYTGIIEAIVREDPTQYWWVHRRWKTAPKKKTAAL